MKEIAASLIAQYGRTAFIQNCSFCFLCPTGSCLLILSAAFTAHHPVREKEYTPNFHM